MSEQISHMPVRPRHHAELERLATERLERLRRNKADKQSPATEPIKQAILTKTANYHHTMVSLQHRMRFGSRRFSKLIHAPAVEAMSDFISSTILRPSICLGATTTAVIFGGFLYLYARHYGFMLQGSEIWIAMVIGGMLGLIGEVVYRLISLVGGRH